MTRGAFTGIVLRVENGKLKSVHTLTHLLQSNFRGGGAGGRTGGAAGRGATGGNPNAGGAPNNP